MTNSLICPICRRLLGEGAEEARFRPFCSKRCADIDLGRWLKGAYAIPVLNTDDESVAPPEGGLGEDQQASGKTPVDPRPN